MSINLDKSIEWFKSMSGTTYSMTGNRDGSDGTGDCSGMVVTALVKGGASNPGWLLNTEYMHDWLLSNDFELIAFNKSWDMKKGDIVILGLKGQSSGAAGHTFMAVDGTNAIDCAWYGSTTVNAVRIRNENVQPYSMGFYVYRLRTKSTSKPKVNSNYWDTAGRIEVLKDVPTYNKNFTKQDPNWKLKKGTVIDTSGIVITSSGSTHARVGENPNLFVTLSKEYVKRF